MEEEHYLAIDVGGTKTLFAVFKPDGEQVCQTKVETPDNYDPFKTVLDQNIKQLDKFKFSHACCAIPGRIDFDKGIGQDFGNLPWKNVPVLADLQAMLPDTKILIHNDAKLAGLSETLLLKGQYKKVLYLTISTGIGGAVITNDTIDPDFTNFEPGQMVFEHDGKMQQWEDIASGRTFMARYGKPAAEIDDPAIWQEYVKLLTAGMEDVLANVQPDAVIIGGGVGAHFEKFKSYLESELANINNPMVPTPPLLKAQRPEEAVIYGCYDYITQSIG